jgi:hypothetical protein
MSIGRALLDTPMGDMIQQMAIAIAESQLALDESSLRVAEMMSGRIQTVDETGATQTEDTRVYFGKDESGDPEMLSMMELGFTPTFYQFVDTQIEVKMAISITRESEYERRTQGTIKRFSWNKSGIRISSTPVDATYSSKYSYSAEGSSLLRTKMVPVPAPAILEDRIRALIENEED